MLRNLFIGLVLLFTVSPAFAIAGQINYKDKAAFYAQQLREAGATLICANSSTAKDLQIPQSEFLSTAAEGSLNFMLHETLMTANLRGVSVSALGDFKGYGIICLTVQAQIPSK